MTKKKSLASDIFEILKEYPVGETITSSELKIKCKLRGLQVSDGAVQGFINRAINKGVLKVTGIYKTPKNQTGYFYSILNHTPWNFHGPSHGSTKGRVIKGTNHQTDLPIIETEAIHNGEKITVLDKPKIEPKKEEPASPPSLSMADWALECVQNGTAFGEMDVRLTEAFALMGALRLSQKTISDMTTDELLAEIKRRTKE